jgi:hypothetical protein
MSFQNSPPLVALTSMSVMAIANIVIPSPNSVAMIALSLPIQGGSDSPI